LKESAIRKSPEFVEVVEVDGVCEVHGVDLIDFIDLEL
jgi:hypothetical protein